MSHKYTYGVKTKKRPNAALIILGLTIFVLGGLTVTNLFDSNPKKLVPVVARHAPVAVPKVVMNYALPVRLQIPKLQVDANVKYLGLNKDGRMSVPSEVKDAGWYKYSSLPGNTGTAVIGGHLNGLKGEPGVFNKLSKLVAGDSISVIESNGQTINYIVRETKNYGQDEQPDEVFKSSSGTHLNLITCTGSWDTAEHRYAKRLVVFADKAS